jgi:hypothetical protein
MTDVSSTAHEQGRAGRPLSPANRRSRLKVSFIKSIGVENLTPEISEAILSAVEMTVLAADIRRKITKSGAATSEDLLALVRVENAAARAVARLPVPHKISTVVDEA